MKLIESQGAYIKLVTFIFISELRLFFSEGIHFCYKMDCSYLALFSELFTFREDPKQFLNFMFYFPDPLYSQIIFKGASIK